MTLYPAPLHSFGTIDLDTTDATHRMGLGTCGATHQGQYGEYQDEPVH